MSAKLIRRWFYDTPGPGMAREIFRVADEKFDGKWTTAHVKQQDGLFITKVAESGEINILHFPQARCGKDNRACRATVDILVLAGLGRRSELESLLFKNPELRF